MKKLYSLLFIVFAGNLEAENVVALLHSVEDNHTLHMGYRQQRFICKPYGVETVSELILRFDVNSSCRDHLKNFRRSNPKEEFYAAASLHVQQQYSVEGIESLCLLHLSSGHTYSEALLEKGYARMPRGKIYKDVILKYRFKNAVQRAKNTKAGIWSDLNVRNCFLIREGKE